VRLSRLEDVVALAQVHRDIQLKTALERDVRLVRFDEGQVEFALEPGASPQVAAHLMRRLQEWTGQRWMVAVVTAEGAPTLRQQAEARQAEATLGVRSHPLVRSALARFPDAEIVDVRAPNAAPQDAPAPREEPSDEVAYADETYTDEDL
jgi:DNA polymerase-3 subunit gamma/tau